MFSFLSFEEDTIIPLTKFVEISKAAIGVIVFNPRAFPLLYKKEPPEKSITLPTNTSWSAMIFCLLCIFPKALKAEFNCNDPLNTESELTIRDDPGSPIITLPEISIPSLTNRVPSMIASP